MRSSSNEIGSDVGLVVVAVALLVAGAWIALAGRFTVALMVIGGLAALASFAAIRYLVRHQDGSGPTHV